MNGKLNLFQKLGFALVLLSMAVLLGTEALSRWDQKKAEAVAQALGSRLGALSQGDPENYSDTAMPVLQLDGEDFSGLLEVPAFGVTLPIGSTWEAGSTRSYPRRFWGSAYDNSLIVGGSDRRGQFDFCEKLDVGDRVWITDMTGARFSYEVTRIDRRKHADMDVFGEKDSDLILFVRENSSLDYILVRCAFAP